MAARGKAHPPVILATHPTDEQRVRDLKAFLPKAKTLAEKYK
jgi:predicted Zn-dependent protease